VGVMIQVAAIGHSFYHFGHHYWSFTGARQGTGLGGRRGMASGEASGTPMELGSAEQHEGEAIQRDARFQVGVVCMRRDRHE
jgi:hypothetical protein